MEIWCVGAEVPKPPEVVGKRSLLCAEVWIDGDPVGRTRWSDGAKSEAGSGGAPCMYLWDDRFQVPAEGVSLKLRALIGSSEAHTLLGEGVVELQTMLRTLLPSRRSGCALQSREGVVGQVFFECRMMPSPVASPMAGSYSIAAPTIVAQSQQQLYVQSQQQQQQQQKQLLQPPQLGKPQLQPPGQGQVRIPSTSARGQQPTVVVSPVAAQRAPDGFHPQPRQLSPQRVQPPRQQMQPQPQPQLQQQQQQQQAQATTQHPQAKQSCRQMLMPRRGHFGRMSDRVPFLEAEGRVRSAASSARGSSSASASSTTSSSPRHELPSKTSELTNNTSLASNATSQRRRLERLLLCGAGGAKNGVSEPEVVTPASATSFESQKNNSHRSKVTWRHALTQGTPRITKVISRDSHQSARSSMSEGTRLSISHRGQTNLNDLMHSKDKLRELAERPFQQRNLAAGGRLTMEEFEEALTDILAELEVTAPKEEQMKALFEKHTRGNHGMDVESFEAMLFRMLCFMRASQEVRVQRKKRDLSVDRDRNWREEFLHKNPLKFSDVYDVVDKLGKGSFGTCYTVRHKTLRDKDNHSRFRVCKIISKAKAKQANTPESKVREEFAVLKQLDHPNVLRLFEDFEDEENFYLVTETCRGGDLSEYVKCLEPMDAFTYERWVGKVLQHTLSAVAYCHAKAVIHKDLKPENVMLSTDRQTPWQDMQVVVVDFGLAEVFEGGSDGRNTTISGTPPYMAPEVWRRNFTKSCDLWSVGVMMFFLLSGRLPFMAKEIKDFPKALQSDPRWELMGGATVEAQDFCKKLLMKSEQYRPSAQQSLQHRWFEILGLGAGGAATAVLDSMQVKTLLGVGKRSEFEKFVTRFVATQLDSSQQKKVNDAFRSLDSDHDGLLSQKELVSGLAQFGASQAVAEQVARELDVGGTGKISYTEFLAGVINLKSKHPEERDRLLMIAWEQFLPNEDGRVLASTVSDALAARGMAVADLPEAFCSALNNKDGEANGLSFEDFKHLILRDDSDVVIKTLAGEKQRGAKLLRWLMRFMA